VPVVSVLATGEGQGAVALRVVPGAIENSGAVTHVYCAGNRAKHAVLRAGRGACAQSLSSLAYKGCAMQMAHAVQHQPPASGASPVRCVGRSVGRYFVWSVKLL
jgi:hypothetical protein